MAPWEPLLPLWWLCIAPIMATKGVPPPPRHYQSRGPRSRRRLATPYPRALALACMYKSKGLDAAIKMQLVL